MSAYDWDEFLNSVKQSTSAPNIAFQPRSSAILKRVEDLAEKLNYPLDVTSAQRTLGPRPNVMVPPQGCEIFVTKLPREMFEDKLLPLFATVGEIYKFRLMMSPSGISNRSIAYITYQDTQSAQMAILKFDNYEVEPGCRIEVSQSVDNRRIFIGGIPEEKNKNQVWQELQKIGMKGIVEVIMYRSYIDRNKNRGFVFVEFSSHEEAARVRLDFRNAFVFGNRVQIDWSAPLNQVDDLTMKRVKKLFVRNLNVLQEKDEFEEQVHSIVGANTVEKVYKYRDYSFIHFVSRRDAQRGMTLLREHYKYTDVEVAWAKPVPKKRHANSTTSSNSSSSSSPKSTTSSSSNELQGANNIVPFNANALEWAPMNMLTLYCPNCRCQLPDLSQLSLNNSIERTLLELQAFRI